MSGRVATISTHNGSSVSVGHNIRDPEICRYEEHIDPNGPHEIWKHEDLRDFYERTFGEAQREYDERQGKREERKIGDYLDKLARDAAEAEKVNEEIRERNKEHKLKGEPMERLKVAKKPVYEMIAGVYVQDGPPLSKQEKRDMLHLYVMGDGTAAHPSWEQRHPGLKLVGVYYHGDEPKADDHIHIDYVPVAECNRGMKVQNSLEKALNLEGLRSEKFGGSAQIQFEAVENAYLQRICEESGITVEHPQRGKRSKHKSTDEKKRETALKERERQAEERDKQLDKREQEIGASEARQRAAEQAAHVNEVRTQGELEKAREERQKAKEDRQRAKEQVDGVAIELSRKQAELKVTETKLAQQGFYLKQLQEASHALEYYRDLADYARTRKYKDGSTVLSRFEQLQAQKGRPRELSSVGLQVLEQQQRERGNDGTQASL